MQKIFNRILRLLFYLLGQRLPMILMMIGLFRLIITLCVIRNVLSIKRESAVGKPMPWHLFVSQECKEEAQIVCTECGWANCVPKDSANEPDDLTCCPHVRLAPNELNAKRMGIMIYAENKDDPFRVCCPTNYVFKCCTLLSEQKYTWRAENMAVFEYEKNNYCPKVFNKEVSSGHEYHCYCDIMAPFMVRQTCCELFEGTPESAEINPCNCCKKDQRVTKLPEIFKFTKWNEDDECKLETKKYNNERKEEYNLACFFKEGEKASKCCDENYALSTVKDHLWRDIRPMECVSSAVGRCKTPGVWKLLHNVDNMILRMGQSSSSFSEEVSKLWVLSPIPNFAIKPPSYVYHHWLRKKTEDMVAELEKKSNNECKGKPIYCACDPLHYDRIMTGMCCDKTTRCECCSKIFLETATKTRKTLVRDPAPGESCQSLKNQFRRRVTSRLNTQTNNCTSYKAEELAVFCLWSEGSPASACCAKDYQLVELDERYAPQKIDISSSYAAIQGMSRRHPLCPGRLPWIHPLVCAHEWYYVPYMKQ